VSVSKSWFCYCDDCDGRIDSGDQGHNEADSARRSARMFSGMKRRKLDDGKVYDICGDCDRERAALDEYDRRVPSKR
jgi:hypothetical protein